MTNRRWMATGLLVAGALATAATATGIAAAEPPVPEIPVDPAAPAIPAPPPNSTPLGPLAQSEGTGGLGGMPADISGNALLLGQSADPAAPGVDPGTPPVLNAWNNAYLLPQNVEPAAPGTGTVVGVVPGNEDGETSRLDYLRRLHASYQDGALRGALLGQLPEPAAPPINSTDTEPAG